MTRKNYELIAATIRDEYQGGLENYTDAGVFGAARIRMLALSLAERFAEDNPRFIAERFLVACGLPVEGI